MTANKPNAATRRWAGKTSQKDPKGWKPFTGKWKVIKLPRDAGITPELTAKEYESGRSIHGSWQ